MELFFILLLLIPLFLLVVYSLYHAYKVQKNGGYFLAIVSLISFLAIYCVGILDYKVSGQHFGLEEQMIEITKGQKQLTKEQEQLNQIVQILVKMIYVSQDQALLIGNPPQYTEELEKCKNELKGYLGEGFNENIDDLLRSLKPSKP